MKINWWAVALFAAAIAWGFREGCACVKKKEAGDVVKRDTPIYLPGKTDTVYVPEPYKVIETKAVKVPVPTSGKDIPLFDEPAKPDRDFEMPELSLRIPADTAYYRDSLPVAHGYAIIQDTVNENRISGRGFRLNQTIPVIRGAVQTKPRNVVYVGLNAAGSKQNYFYKIGADVSLLTKKGAMYGIGSAVTTDNRLLIEAAGRWPLRFGSKR